MVLLLPHGSEARVVRRASLHLHCLGRVLVAILCMQESAEFLERVGALSEDEPLVASLGDFDGIKVGLGDVSNVNDGEINLGKGWHETQ